MEQFYTQKGNRPDLQALVVNLPEGYIGNKVFPVTTVAEKSGTIYYSTVTANSAAQTNRVSGAAPATTLIANSSTTYTCVENIKRSTVDVTEVKTFGSVAKSDEMQGKWVKKQIARAQEAAQVAALLTAAADVSFDGATFGTQVQTGLDAIRNYSGKTALVGATSLIKTIMANSDVSAKLLRVVTGVNPSTAAEGLAFKLGCDALATWLGVDMVLAGDSAIWTASSAAGKVAIVKIDESGDALSYKYEPIIGKTYVYLPDPALVDGITINSNDDRVNLVNIVDGYSHFVVKQLNAAKYIIGSVS